MHLKVNIYHGNCNDQHNGTSYSAHASNVAQYTGDDTAHNATHVEECR